MNCLFSLPNSKAEELYRILESRGQSSLKGLNLAGDAKLILCLDCAASTLGSSINKVQQVDDHV